MTPQETLANLQGWLRSGCAPEYVPPPESELDAAISAVLEENEQLKIICTNLMNDADPSLRAENERLRARIVGLEDPCAVAGRHVCGPGDAEARIEAALAAAVTLETAIQGKPRGMSGYEQAWIDTVVLGVRATVKAIRGEK